MRDGRGRDHEFVLRKLQNAWRGSGEMKVVLLMGMTRKRAILGSLILLRSTRQQPGRSRRLATYWTIKKEKQKAFILLNFCSKH